MKLKSKMSNDMQEKDELGTHVLAHGTSELKARIQGLETTPMRDSASGFTSPVLSSLRGNSRWGFVAKLSLHARAAHPRAAQLLCSFK